MSGQNTLLVIADDPQVKRPYDLYNWQVYRDTAAAGSGTYKAMNFAGVVEIIGGPGVADIETGTYTPVITPIANVDAASFDGPIQWSRVKDVVTFSGSILIDAAVTLTTTILEIPPPKVSNFTISNQAGGTFVTGTNAGALPSGQTVSGSIGANAAADSLRFVFFPVSVANERYRFVGQYIIV